MFSFPALFDSLKQRFVGMLCLSGVHYCVHRTPTTEPWSEPDESTTYVDSVSSVSLYFNIIIPPRFRSYDWNFVCFPFYLCMPNTLCIGSSLRSNINRNVINTCRPLVGDKDHCCLVQFMKLGNNIKSMSMALYTWEDIIHSYWHPRASCAKKIIGKH
jgi:hypothetical protein